MVEIYIDRVLKHIILLNGAFEPNSPKLCRINLTMMSLFNLSPMGDITE